MQMTDSDCTLNAWRRRLGGCGAVLYKEEEQVALTTRSIVSASWRFQQARITSNQASIPATSAGHLVFTALHVMQTRYCDEISVRLSVCLSVRPSVTRVDCDKAEKRSVQIFIPYERTFSLVFWEEEWLVGGDPFYLKFWVNRPPLERNRRFSTNNRS